MSNLKKKLENCTSYTKICINQPCNNFLPQQVIQELLASLARYKAQLILEACPAIRNNDLFFYK